MIKLAPPLLLSILCCSNEGAAFDASRRPAVTSRRLASAAPRRHIAAPLSVSTNGDFDADRHGVDVHRSTGQLDRRNALARFAAAAVAFSGAGIASAAEELVFSESPTSEAAIGRMGYDGKVITPPPPPPAPPVAEVPPLPPPPAPPAAEAVPPPAPVVAAEAPDKDLDGNKAGAVGASDEGTQAQGQASTDFSFPTFPTLPSIKLPPYLADVDPKNVAGGAVAVSLLAVLVNTYDNEDGGVVAPPPLVKASAPAPPAAPYGMTAGRNYWEGVDMNAAKQAGLVAAAPPRKEPAAPVAVARAVAVAVAEKRPEEPKPSWVLDKPTPYGLQNKDGYNPYIKEVLEYCEGGVVSDPCAGAIKDYLEDIADTGAAATVGEAEAIAGYLDSLGDDDGAGEGKAGAAFERYLDALSEGSAPPPSSAKAVETYLSALDNGPDIVGALGRVEMAVEATPPFDTSEFDSRITNIEGRVASLEDKVDRIPDQVFEKIEAWQSRNEERLADEVKKIVGALTPPPPAPAPPVAAQPAFIQAPPTPEPAADETPVFAVEPAPETPAVVVPATPLAAAIPLRPSMPQRGAGGPKKGYGFGGVGGGGASWKAEAGGDPSPITPNPGPVDNAYSPEPTQQVEPTWTEPDVIVPATPLAAAIPLRPSMPQPGSGGPKKGYGFGGVGGGWKTSEPRSDGGYLDGMGP